MTAQDLYRWNIFSASGGVSGQVYPQNDTIEWEFVQNKDFKRVYDTNLVTTLRFVDNQDLGINDFTTFFSMERSGQWCEKINVSVDKYDHCTKTWETEWWKGYIRLSDAKWDVDRCVVEIKVNAEKEFQCLNEKIDEELNVYRLGEPPVQLDLYIGEIEYAYCSEPTEYFVDLSENRPAPYYQQIGDLFTQYNSSCLDAYPQTWTPFAHYLYGTWVEGNYGWQFFVITYWAREVYESDTPPTGEGWVTIDTNKYARPAPVRPLEPLINQDQYQGVGGAQDFLAVIRGLFTGQPYDFFDTNNNLDQAYAFVGNVVGFGEDGLQESYTNAKRFNPILEQIVNDCGYELVSDFLNINPDGTAPANEYYTKAAEDAQNLYVLVANEVALLDETNPATDFPTTLKKIVQMLETVYNLQVGATADDPPKLRIEHASFWNDVVQEDFTSSPEKEAQIAGFWKYERANDKIKSKEYFFWAQVTDGEGNDFDGFPIEYDNICTKDNPDVSEDSYRADGWLSHLESITGDEDYTESKLLILAAADGDGDNLSIARKTVPISNEVRLNGQLAFGYLLPTYHTYERPFRQGIINRQDVEMKGIRRTRRQELPIFVDSAAFIKFDPVKLIRTQLGGGKVERAKYRDPAQILELTLLFP